MTTKLTNADLFAGISGELKAMDRLLKAADRENAAMMAETLDALISHLTLSTASLALLKNSLGMDVEMPKVVRVSKPRTS